MRTVAAGDAGVHESEQSIMNAQHFFSNLQRPAKPNSWLVAPADFIIKPDAIAPVFAVPTMMLHDAFKTVVRQAQGAVLVGNTGNGLHVVVTTPVFGFKDDIRALFIPIAPQQSALALYSASRMGYWDTGTNRRRIEGWLRRIGEVLASGKS